MVVVAVVVAVEADPLCSWRGTAFGMVSRTTAPGILVVLSAVVVVVVVLVGILVLELVV